MVHPESEIISVIRQNQKRAYRTCLMCGAYFLSEGPHNRRCVPCDTKLYHAERNVQHTYYMPARYAVPNQAMVTAMCAGE